MLLRSYLVHITMIALGHFSAPGWLSFCLIFCPFQSGVAYEKLAYKSQLLISVNLYQHAKNQAITLICSGDMAITENILAHISRKNFFPNIGFVQEHSK